MAGLSNGYADDALREPTYVKQKPFHPFRREVHGLLDNAYGVAAFPLPIERHNSPNPGQTTTGPYVRGASAWREVNTRYQHSEKFKTMLHLFTHAFEIKNNGCPTFIGRPGSQQVRAAQMAFLRTVEGRARKEDRAILEGHSGERGIKQTLSMDQRVAEAIRAIASGELNSEIPGRDSVPLSGEEDDMADGMDTGIGGRRGGGGGGGRRRRRGRRGEAEDDGSDSDGGDDNSNPDEEMDMRILELFEQQLGDMEGAVVIEKLQVLVVHMTRPVIGDNGLPKTKLGPARADGSRIEETEMEDAGCVVFFCIMDPLYSIGKALFNVIDMAEEHDRAVKGMSAHENGSGQDGQSNGPGGKKRWNPSSSNGTRLTQFFPWITAPEHKENALLSLSMEKYLDLVAFVRDEPSLLLEDRQKYMSRGMSDPGTDSNPNKLHPLNVFTPNWALRVMAVFGVEEDQCGMERFRGANYMTEMDMSPLLRWYFPPQDTYHYTLEAWTYNRPGKAGLKNQYWPWITVPESMLRLTAVRTENNALTLYEGQTVTNVLGATYTEMCMIPGRGVVMPLPDMPYDPHAMQRQSAIFQVASENRLVLSTIVAPRDPETMHDAYRKYCDQMTEMRAACLMRMQQILVPTAHLAPAFKLILMFMAQKVKKVGTYLPHYTMNPTDPCPAVMPLDLFSQYIIREALYVKNFRFIAAEIRHWQIVHHGLKDAYSLFGVDMHIGLIYFGLSQGGKSFFAKDGSVKTTVEGTVSQMLESSNRAFNTHDDFTAAVVFKDEIDNIYVDAKAAANDKSGQAERIKSMLSDHKATYRVLTFIDQANGRQRRVAEDIESLYHAVLICCTNKRVGKGDEAIASRFLNFAITRAEVDLFEYLGINERLDDLDKQRNDDFVKMLQVKQCLVAITMALIDAGALPEPSMDVYDTLLSRMLSYLNQQGLDTSAVRGAQMTKRLARVYVILNAIVMLYDRPGAKYAKKDFELWQLADLLPYLWCSKQITIFAITQTGEIYVHPLQSIVIKATFKMAGIPYEKGKTIEDRLKGDTAKKIPWKMEQLSTENAAVNLNYITLPGDYANVVLKTLAELAKPRIGVNEVDSELTAMSNQFITVKPLMLVSKAFYDARKPAEMMHFPLVREDVPRQIQVVIRDLPNNEVYVAIEALNHYREDILVDAFLSCIHDGFRPQEFLLGTQLTGPHPVKADREHTYTGIYQTLSVTPVAVDLFSMGKAFTVNDVAYMAPIINEMFAGGRLDPDKKKEPYEKERKKRSKVVIAIDEDLDDWGQKVHHYRTGTSGFPEDSPGRALAVFQSTREYLLKLEKKHDRAERANRDNANDPNRRAIKVVNERSLLVDYPEELRQSEDERLVLSGETRNFSSGQKYRHDVYLAQKAEYQKLLPAERALVEPPREAGCTDFKSGGRLAVYTEEQRRRLLLSSPADIASDALVAIAAIQNEDEADEYRVNPLLAKQKREQRAAKSRAVPGYRPTERVYHRQVTAAEAEPPPPGNGQVLLALRGGIDEYVGLDGDEEGTRLAHGLSSTSLEPLARADERPSSRKRAKGTKKNVPRSASRAMVFEQSLSGFGDD